MRKEYNKGLAILKVLSMLGIVGLHILNAGGAMLRGNEISLTNSLLHILYIFCNLLSGCFCNDYGVSLLWTGNRPV